MKRITQISILISLMLLFATANLSAQEVRKSFHESYDVKADAKVSIDNKYGRVRIHTWDRNEVVIDVQVSVDAKSENESQRILDKINVKITGSADLVKAITTIDGKLNCKNCNMNIEYEVKMPASNALVLYNEFGNAYVENLSGNTLIKIGYGNLVLGELTSKENNIEVKFGDAEIAFLKAGDLIVEYGSLDLGKAGYLDMYSRFSGLEIGSVSELDLDSQYDGIEIGSVDNMRAKASFTSIEIGEVFDKLDLTSSYGGVEIDRVAGGFSSIDITSEFGGVELNISSSASYKLHARSSFGDIDFPEGKATVTKHVEKSFEKEVEAFIGDDKSSSSTVVVTVRNCDVEIY